MFNDIDQQTLADLLKAHLLRISNPAERRFAIGILQMFERAPWYPQVFEQAVKEDHRLTFNGSEFEVAGNPASIIPPILVRYDELVNAGLPRNQMGTTDAMEYVARKLTGAGHPMSGLGVKKYINRNEIPNQMIGGSRVFSVAALDDFIASYLANPPRPGPKGPRKHKAGVF